MNSATQDPAITTFTGRKFYPLDPNPDDIDIEDIAHGLSMKCWYNGHSLHFYSVAEHSWLMSSLFENPMLRMAALLHDAAEAYLCDVPSPVKRLPMMAGYCEAEDRLQSMIYEKFGLQGDKLRLIDQADKYMLHVETASPIVGSRHPDWKPPEITETFPSLIVSGFRPQIIEEAFLRAWKEVEHCALQSSACTPAAS